MKSKIKYSENELVALLVSGEKKAFEYLYDNYAATLYGVLRKITRDEELAQDVLQEAFVKIWNNISKYDPNKGTLFTWMLNLSRNLAIDKLRGKRFKYEIQSLDQNVSMLEGNNTVEQSIETIGIKTKITDVLTEDKRQIIDAIYFGGLTQEEAAKELNIPLGTLKTKCRTALLELRAYFK